MRRWCRGAAHKVPLTELETHWHTLAAWDGLGACSTLDARAVYGQLALTVLVTVGGVAPRRVAMACWGRWIDVWGRHGGNCPGEDVGCQGVAQQTSQQVKQLPRRWAIEEAFHFDAAMKGVSCQMADCRNLVGGETLKGPQNPNPAMFLANDSAWVTIPTSSLFKYKTSRLKPLHAKIAEL